MEVQTVETWVEDMGPNACLLAPLVPARRCCDVHTWLRKQGYLESQEGSGGTADKDKPILDLETLAAPARRRRRRCDCRTDPACMATRQLPSCVSSRSNAPVRS